LPPFFSIITPVLNRPRLIRRTIESILAQDFTDWEMIVVDDASTDDTPDVVLEYADRGVKLVRSPGWVGHCRARNIAIENAVGEWVVPVDSDDELLPHALSTMKAKIDEVGPDIARLRFMTRLDTGQLTPRPPLVEEEWDYEGYLKFVDRSIGGGSSETLSCVRRSTFETVRYPDDRATMTQYHFDFAAKYRQKTFPIVLRLYHLDADNQITYVPNSERSLATAEANARSYDAILADHGADLKRVAPRAYLAITRAAAKHNLLAGRRGRGVRLLGRIWRRKPFMIEAWALFATGMFSPRVIAWADGARRRYLRRRLFAGK
jgi:glycosyltransferase involved in cell wall biosynthesis